jgi:peptide/nickel transport system ATP-binding protein
MEQRKDILLDVRELHTSFFTSEGEVKSVNGVSFHVNRQEIVAIVGESGCGKSVTQMSVMQLVTAPGKIKSGKVMFEGDNLLNYGPNSKEMRSVRGAKISMVFQEPMTSLNPVFTVGFQLSKVIRVHKHVSKKEAWKIGIESLAAVGIPDPEERMRNYPFEMSGGMRQRVLIALAIACNSKLIIADEPTTALDVTTQAQVMELLIKIVKDYGTSIIMVTHNLGLVSRYADRIYVMYAGSIVESGTSEELLTKPKHPYTVGLLDSVPRLDDDKTRDLISICGAPPSLVALAENCAFMPRCKYACGKCRNNPRPNLYKVGDSEHYTACYLNGLEGKIGC